MTKLQKIEPANTTPAMLLEIAVSQNADIDKLDKLMELQMMWEANEARKAYHKAMAAFKKNAPEIIKDQSVSYGQGKAQYKHASLFNVTQTINSEMTNHGFSASWHIAQPNGMVEVTCTITHELGHAESTSMIAPPDGTGSKNIVQQIGSTVTYLQRYTLLSLTGLATKDSDNDARMPDKSINENQEAEIINLLQTKKVDINRVFGHFKVNTLSDLSYKQYRGLVNDLKAM